jgi:hypothetical protein
MDNRVSIKQEACNDYSSGTWPNRTTTSCAGLSSIAAGTLRRWKNLIIADLRAFLRDFR